MLPWLVADTGAYRFILYRIDHRTDMSFEVLDPTTGALLSRILTAAPGDFAQGGTFTVPTSGAVQIRIGRIPGAEAAAAPYEFVLGPAPHVP